MSFATISKRPKPVAMTGSQAKRPFARSWTPPSSAVPQRLTVGPANHPLETEADRVADQAMRVSVPRGGTAARVHENEMVSVQAGESVSTDNQDSSLVTPTVVNRIDAARRRGGIQLEASLRRVFEPRFNADFGNVRVHTNSQSAETSRAMNARAFTVGSDLFFGRGEYQPNSASGRHLIAHELTHSLQNARIGHNAASTGVIRRFQSPSTERDPARDRDRIIGWIASIVVTLASRQKPEMDSRAIAEQVLAQALASGKLGFDGEHMTIAQIAERLTQGGDIAVGRYLLTIIISQAGLQMSLDEADAVLTAAREAAPLLEAAEELAPLLGGGLPATLEELDVESEDPIEIPGTQAEEDAQPCDGEQPCRGEQLSEADSTEEPETPSMSPASMAAAENSKNSKMLEGGIAVLQPATTTGSSTYVAAGAVKLGKKSDAKLKNKLAEEARFGLFACFPEVDPVTAAVLIDTNKIVLDVPSADKMRAHGVTEVTVAMDIPNLENQLSSHSRCSDRKGLIELSNAKALGQL
ncbi:hypothetical protein ENSA5_11930 [Enhygromyxa salina]|uniref:eCIS core domain-containing protein n=2 Tax=Enhygromyxa salina TaxID=215803 RepID=A0A2S9YFX2_9BACT|nr:hypothetical protein ENSA5_11930 [Enhygromyxa salina]